MSQQPERDRDWEHWPGRRPTQERTKRGRLKSLFSPTDGPETIEALITERGRELAIQTQHLASTISDLEQREERARQLRFAVEEMLRTGSQELDDRHAELNSLASELARREDALSRAELEIAERRREAGAVELRRAALERREAAIADREAALERIASELEARERQLRATRASTPDPASHAELAHRDEELRLREEDLELRSAALTELRADLEARHATLAQNLAELDRLRRTLTTDSQPRGGTESDAPALTPGRLEPEEREHLLFLSGERYRIVSVPGPAPHAGALLELEGTTYRVLKVCPSPLPADRRRCAYLQAQRARS